MDKKIGAGGVVVKMEKGAVKVLLIKDSYGHWTWPKGHMEKDETPAETAVREIQEETGLNDLEVIEELGRQEYYFTLRGQRIFKTVHIFLVKAVHGEKITVQKSEIETAEWFDAKDAIEKIEYKGSRELLEKGIGIFRGRFMSK